MGRKPKNGLDYYMCDVDWMMDSKFRRIKQKYGYLAPFAYQILLSMIYKDKGYYIDASNIEDLALDVLEYLQGKYTPKAETVIDMIADLVACGLFSHDLYEIEHILTSRRIQEEYYNSTTKRQAVTVNKRYWLLSVEEMQTISNRSRILSIFISDGRNEENDVKNEENDVRSTQRREEEKREEKSRVENSRLEESRGESLSLTDDEKRICLRFSDAFRSEPNTGFVKKIREYLVSGWSADEIVQIIESAKKRGPREPIPYVLASLKSKRDESEAVNVLDKDRPLEDWEKDWLEEYHAMAGDEK